MSNKRNKREKMNGLIESKETKAQLAVTRQEMFSGPMPHPDILARYDEIVPGAAERILVMAENQAKHRQEIEKLVVQSKVNDSKRGLNYGFIISLAFLFVAAFLGYMGREIVASVLGAIDIVALASTFIYGNVSSKRELKNKRESSLNDYN